MFTKLKLTMISAALVLGTAGIAAAKPAGHDGRGGKDMMEKLDTNKDGKLDAAEKAAGKALFAAKHAERKAKMLAQFDANKNGVLDDAEKQAKHDARSAERFAKLDANKDGVLSLAEFKAGKQGRGGHHARKGRGGFRGRP